MFAFDCHSVKLKKMSRSCTTTGLEAKKNYIGSKLFYSFSSLLLQAINTPIFALDVITTVKICFYCEASTQAFSFCRTDDFVMSCVPNGFIDGFLSIPLLNECTKDD